MKCCLRCTALDAGGWEEFVLASGPTEDPVLDHDLSEADGDKSRWEGSVIVAACSPRPADHRVTRTEQNRAIVRQSVQPRFPWLPQL